MRALDSSLSFFTSESEFSVSKAALDTFLGTLSNCGEVFSMFIKPRPSIRCADHGQWMREFLLRFAPLAEQTLMGALDVRDGAQGVQFSLLNRYEFEGSLIALMHEGGCHSLNRDLPVAQVRQQVGEMLEAVFPEPFSSLWVYRFDDLEWCPRMNEATTAAGYLVRQADRDLWWLLCVSDED